MSQPPESPEVLRERVSQLIAAGDDILIGVGELAQVFNGTINAMRSGDLEALGVCIAYMNATLSKIEGHARRWGELKGITHD